MELFVMHKKNKRYGHIIDAFNFYGAGAFIEITNGIHPNTAENKAGQAVEGKNFFMKLVNKRVDTKTGLVYIKNFFSTHPKGVDFCMKIPEYDPVKLDKVLVELLDNKVIKSRNKEIIEKLLQAKEKGDLSYSELLNPNNQTYEAIKRVIGMFKYQYDPRLAALKGYVLESYMANLFKEEEIGKVFTRTKYSVKKRPINPEEDNSCRRRKWDLDLLVVDSMSKIKKAIEKVSQKTKAELILN